MAHQGGYGGYGGGQGGYNNEGYGSGHGGQYGGEGYGRRDSGAGGGYQQSPPPQPTYSQYPPQGGPPQQPRYAQYPPQGGPPSQQGHSQYPPQGGPPSQQGHSQYPPQGGPPSQQGYSQYPQQGGPPTQHGYNQHPPQGGPAQHGYGQHPAQGGPPPQQGYSQYPPQGAPASQHGYNQYPAHGAPAPAPAPQHGYSQYPPQGGAASQPPRPTGYGAPSNPSHQGQSSYGYSNAGAPVGARPTGPPPTTPQQFGHGAPDGYTFQYSNCTGKRKALLIGINYFGQDTALAGCINDTKNLSAFLIERYNYKREDMIILTDDQQNPVLQPTKANILRAMQWLVKDARPNDALFLHYSGHGGQTADLDGDEEDGSDEVIYPVDYKVAGHIVDDQLHHIVVTPLVAGVRLTAIFDSCHSGSVLDIPYLYSTRGILKEPNLAAEAGQGLLRAISAYASGNTGGVASAIMGIAMTAVKGDSAYKKTVETKTSPADVIMWSGSRDDQTSADATIASQASGAMSYAFITALRKNPNQSYVQLLNSIRDILEPKYSQKPQLSCSHPLDTNLLFVM